MRRTTVWYHYVPKYKQRSDFLLICKRCLCLGTKWYDTIVFLFPFYGGVGGDCCYMKHVPSSSLLLSSLLLSLLSAVSRELFIYVLVALPSVVAVALLFFGYTLVIDSCGTAAISKFFLHSSAQKQGVRNGISTAYKQHCRVTTDKSQRMHGTRLIHMAWTASLTAVIASSK